MHLNENGAPLVADVDKQKASNVMFHILGWCNTINYVSVAVDLDVHAFLRTDPCSRLHPISHRCLTFLTCQLSQAHSVRF